MNADHEIRLIRFWSKVEKKSDDECWLWSGGTRGGYGIFTSGQVRSTTHRFSYEIHHGPIPGGLQIRHSCHNRRCVNPKHLSVGTNRDNRLDTTTAGRHNAPHGAQHHNAKLTDSLVKEIRESDEPISIIARRLKLPPSLVKDARHYGWSHVQAIRPAEYKSARGWKPGKALNAKLSPAAVRKIRAGGSRAELAEKYGVSVAAIAAVRNRRNWSTVE